MHASLPTPDPSRPPRPRFCSLRRVGRGTSSGTTPSCQATTSSTSRTDAASPPSSGPLPLERSRLSASCSVGASQPSWGLPEDWRGGQRFQLSLLGPCLWDGANTGAQDCRSCPHPSLCPGSATACSCSSQGAGSPHPGQGAGECPVTGQHRWLHGVSGICWNVTWTSTSMTGWRRHLLALGTSWGTKSVRGAETHPQAS